MHLAPPTVHSHFSKRQHSLSAAQQGDSMFGSICPSVKTVSALTAKLMQDLIHGRRSNGSSCRVGHQTNRRRTDGTLGNILWRARLTLPQLKQVRYLYHFYFGSPLARIHVLGYSLSSTSCLVCGTTDRVSLRLRGLAVYWRLWHATIYRCLTI